MVNLELPTSFLVLMYVVLVMFCLAVVAVAIVVAPDLYEYFSSQGGGLRSISKCNKYLDAGETELYEACLEGGMIR